MVQLSINKINQGENMKQIQSVILLSSLLILSIFSAGRGLLYDCEAAETEIIAMQVNLASQPWVENATFTKCNKRMITYL